MAEHLLIGDIASLLLVLGLTGPVIAPLLRNPVISKLRVLSHPVVAIVLWAVNFYVWHSPYLYQQALRHDALHALEHATFLIFGIAVWMGLLGPLPQPRWFSNSARLVYIIAMRLIGTVLANILIFGPSGTGKTHVASAIGAGLVDHGYRVFFTRTTDLVQKLQAARRDLVLPATLAKLDKFDCIILDDLGYVRKDQAETAVLFELIAERYERKSLIITCNQPFSEWNQIFPDPAVTVAAIDRLVHHSTIIEINTESYRRRTAADNSATANKARAKLSA
jgi:hypothetical protein